MLMLDLLIGLVYPVLNLVIGIVTLSTVNMKSYSR
jgi:hypothetical protein